jgi:uncharacterized protein YndB with AHSA1/START domain
MRFEQELSIRRSPEDVFDYVVDPSKLTSWQIHKTSVEPLTEGPLRQGFRVREHTKPPGAKEFEQIVEFSEFERPSRFGVHIVEGPQPIDGVWTFTPQGDGGTLVRCVVEGDLRGPQRFLSPIVSRMIARQFATYHEHLRQNLESA